MDVMNDSQLSLLLSEIEVYHNVVVILVLYHPDRRLLRYVAFWHVRTGIASVQYPMEY